MSFYMQTLEHKWIIFFVIDQNNKINCLLHFYSCLLLNFHIQLDFLPKQFQSVHEFQEAWFSLKISRQLVFILSKNHPVLEIQTQQCLESRTGLSRKSYFIFLRNINWTCKLQSDFHYFIKFSAKRQLLLLLLPIMSAMLPSNYEVKTYEMK